MTRGPVQGALVALTLFFALGRVARADDGDLALDMADAAARGRAQVQVVEGLVEAGLAEEALQAVAEIRAAGAAPDALDLAQARAMHARGLSHEALVLVEAYVGRHRRDAAGWALQGVLLLDLGRVDDAVRALRRARRRAPEDAALLNNLGWAELAAGDARSAEATLRAALVQDPSSRRTRNNLGFALARQGRDDEALANFRAAGDEADARVNLAAACELRGEPAVAVTHLRAALLARPDHPAALAALARLGTSP